MKRTELFSFASGFSCTWDTVWEDGHVLRRQIQIETGEGSRFQSDPFYEVIQLAEQRKFSTSSFIFLFGVIPWGSKCRAWSRGSVGISWERGKKPSPFGDSECYFVHKPSVLLFPWELVGCCDQIGCSILLERSSIFLAGKIQSAHLMTSSQCFRLFWGGVRGWSLVGFGFPFFPLYWKSTWKKKKKNVLNS